MQKNNDPISGIQTVIGADGRLIAKRLPRTSQEEEFYQQALEQLNKIRFEEWKNSSHPDYITSMEEPESDEK